MRQTQFAQQLGDLERTVSELRTHVRSLEGQLAAARGVQPGKVSLWEVFWRSGGGAGRRGGRITQVRENRRRENHERIAQYTLHCA